MSKTQLINGAYNLACSVAAVAAQSDSLPIPQKYQGWVSLACVMAMLVKSQMNLFINPDGTNAKSAYVPDQKK